MSIDDLIDDFSFLDNWEDRYKYLIELGNSLPRFSDEQKKDEWKVPGCQSQVWIIPTFSTSTFPIPSIFATASATCCGKTPATGQPGAVKDISICMSPLSD